MIKNLVKHGNTHALVFDKTMMELLGISTSSQLQVTVVEGGALLLSPLNVGVSSREVEQHVAQLENEYPGLLQELANQ